ncbi:SIS domain-containing protein [Usitatibacter palustris]|uniref:Glutamine--fructose-6-phosphate aminotransferase [isomerizing] n=1 Tax=Usitatibacter palustris TaxID=2732487 RepID=A0A6M4HFB4_9PROT|nr:SIS domain-containing protein [Usitatibacter palustris]QJR16737.1 Glutamine--fructose-6-phosphate aminotransferase [isomerizing] [Usitatibacter palustris]
MNSPLFDPATTLMYREASEAGAAVKAQFERNHSAAAALGVELRRNPPRTVVTCARGSSDHAATFAKYLIETRTGVITASAAPSIASLYGAKQDLRDCLFLAISQSGRSPDLVSATAAAKQAGARVAVLVNAEDSPLAQIADHVLPLCAGPEMSVAATKSYIASLAAIVHVVAEWTQDKLMLDSLAMAPRQLERAWDLNWCPALENLRAAGHLFVIGRGVGLGIAQEAALKLKETCGLHAEGFSSAEVRHGPQALLSGGFPALLLSQNDETRPGIEELAKDLVARVVDVTIAGVNVPGATVLPTIEAHPAIQPLLLIQSFYRLANAIAVARGLNPDQPPHLRKVTETR